MSLYPGGHVDNSVRLISADTAKTLEIARAHCAPVTCLATSPDSNYLVTGSCDAVVLLWRLHKVSTSQAPNVSDSTGSSTPAGNMTANTSMERRRHRIEGPIHVLRGHLGEISCCCINSDLGIVVSCSNSSDVLLHSIRRGRLIRRLVGVEAHMVCLSSDGVVMAWNRDLKTLSTFTLNGILIARTCFPTSNVGCMEVSADGQNALVGLNPSLDYDGRFSDNDKNLKLSGAEDLGDANDGHRLGIPLPSICFVDIYSLKVWIKCLFAPPFFLPFIVYLSEIQNPVITKFGVLLAHYFPFVLGTCKI